MSVKNVQKRLGQFRLPVDESGNVIIPLDAEGKKNYGAVQRHYRIFVKGWTTQEVAIRYAEALKELNEEEGDEEEEAGVTARWIRLMEQKNKVPVDEKRRWIIATLLGIPAASFGLVPLEPLMKRQEMTTFLVKPKKAIDVIEYRTFLQVSWKLNHAETAQGLQDDIMRRIENLHDEVLYESTKAQMRLLCYYHQLNARIACNSARLPKAIDSMNKAYRIARTLKSRELQALVLFRRGYIYFENGYTKIAVNDFDAAMKLVPHLSQPLQGAVQLAVAHGHAFLAETGKEKTEFLGLLDQAHNNMGRGSVEEDEHFMWFDEDSYVLDKAEALMASPIARLREASEASELIARAMRGTPDFQTALTRVEAKIYLDKGYDKMAATRAIDALNSVSSVWNITDSSAIYQRLKESKYGGMKEVADLELALLKAQKPQLFS